VGGEGRWGWWGGRRGEQGEGEMQICGQVTGSVLPGCFSTTAELLAPRAYYHHQSGRVGGGGSSDLKWGNSLTYCGGSVAGGCVKVGGHGQGSERKRISCGVSDGLEAAEEAQSNRLMEDGAVMVRDDLDMLLQVLPEDLRGQLLQHPRRAELLEVHALLYCFLAPSDGNYGSIVSRDIP
jgi:hypothetical protein